MIHVVAAIELRPGTRERFLREFARLVPEVRAERGCIEYAGAVDLPTGIHVQDPPRPDVVAVIEKWESLAALADHLEAPHMQAYRARVREFVVGTTIKVLEPAGEPA